MTIAIIPESAPFNPEQRAWLNGFLAGWLGLAGDGAAVGTPSPLAAVATLATAATAAAEPVAEPEPEPWHDPALALDERLKLAEGEPLPRRLMSALAQLDCGACGYLCRSYSEAIADGSETRLSLCSPGGSETSKTLKRLLKENPAAATSAATKTVSPAVPPRDEPRWSRETPYSARIVTTNLLNKPGSEKETRHVEIELGSEGPVYAVGDSLGIYPENCEALANDLIAALGADGSELVRSPFGAEAPLATALRTDYCLSEVTEETLQLLAAVATADAESARLRDLIEDDAPIAGFDVLDVLRSFPSARPSPSALVATLAELKPRLYSISSSPERHRGQVHLTVRRVSYEHNGRQRKGVASTMLADRVASGSPVRVFVQRSHGFSLPADPNAAVIMIGPGTGVAPFRAFLHERDATGAPGKNWLFFGDQRSEFDFLYEDELADFVSRGVLTRLDTAFSRDQGRKVYVQDRILEQGAELYRWLEAGAYLYVCGDAKRMAADVDRALRDVVQTHGRLDPDAAKAYVARLSSDKRYRRDVY